MSRSGWWQRAGAESTQSWRQPVPTVHFRMTDQAAAAASFWSRPQGGLVNLPILEMSKEEGGTIWTGTGQTSRRTSR